jgi:hypothetical protein
MNKKVIISFILLLSYTLGIAHNLIPHSHNHDGEKIIISHNANGHQHHQHSDNGTIHKDHEHISHNNHYDESLFDLMVCFINKIDHSTEQCKDQHYLPSKTNSISIKNLKKIKLASVLLILFNEVESNNSYTFYEPLLFTSLTSYIKVSPLRGPPLKI